MDWQTIETAPKDGTPLLLCEEDGAMAVGMWAYGAWTDGDDLVHATHWMPLPPPPGEQTGIPVYKHPDATDEFVSKS